MTGSNRFVALRGGYGLTEAARWYPEHGLVFSDMTRGGVYRFAPGSTEPETVIAHRKAIGGLVAHVDGGFVISGRNVAHKSGDATVVLLEPREDEFFFNDLGADARGRIFCGSMPRTEVRDAGRFYLIDLDGTVSVLTEDLRIANGVHADPSDTVLYSVDSGRCLVWQFALADAAADIAASRELFVDTSEYDAVPDGLAVAADGSVWVAMAGAGCVVGWSPAGEKIAELASPHALTTTLAFGGTGLAELYVLTGDNEDHPNPEGGTVFRTTAPTIGAPAPRAAVRRG
ncbi:SMP-30/gluconolactonase/LRE family protein [Amycolatopsis sp. FDAARGOS 1241]|uniref:SMP-30/gluconolactonase/LRE family protein n=1 Tax=Amycolatopsis sp. FDAARGOS 1241 TaxID=2778070 RepID=UPI001950CF1F|nr:SMP-30/gluconolactonase/LRE family protein [Amycolatopsis sp. FDAARGOS 1241]QRP42847.1 SMP-30/gluconolactonase/LRE family protein [Amycolatopsis sp. FDAARGOS 1241]